ncbi:MAG: hypothetical protein J7L69_12860 [Desulfobulbaceae bacterium]|nr:hypothetical protein [Desulfobulbaceae bacterium]
MEKQSEEQLACQFSEICFGLDRDMDCRSLAAFLKRFSNDTLLATLIPRMSDDDITATLDFLTGIMHKHLRENEYHRLFLAEKKEKE